MATMDIARRNPFADLRALTRMMSRPLWPFELSGIEDLEIEHMNLDVYERNGKLVVKAALPGIDRDNVKVDIVDGVLNIKAERELDREIEEEDYYLHEFRAGKVSRSLRLPADLDMDKVKARFDNGVLFVEFPKTTKANPHSIEVKIA